MPSSKTPPPAINKTAIGDGNVQVAGDNHSISKNVENYVSEDIEQKVNKNKRFSNWRISRFFQIIVGNFNVQIQGNNNIVNIYHRIKKIIDPSMLQKRKDLLKQVEKYWIKEPLEKSLYKKLLIDLRMEEHLETLLNVDQEPCVPTLDPTNRILPAHISILQIFNEMEHAMLILGEPGSGKTTKLLELGRDCTTRAKSDNELPIPVYLNLSWWNNPKQTLSEWIIEILITKYRRSRDEANFWVKKDHLMLLLDGLDEVEIARRNICINLINEFRMEHGSAYIVICSRTKDYEALKTKLDLRSAIELLPLTDEQIKNYFVQLGAETEKAYQLLQNDNQLHELARQPLMLKVIAMVYQDSEIKHVHVAKDINRRRTQLFDAYVEHMFKSRKGQEPPIFQRSDVDAWLSWLARKMIDNKQIPFIPERMRPGWLYEDWQVKIYRLLVGTLIGVIEGFCIAFLSGTVIGSYLGLISGIFFGVYFGIETRIYPIDDIIRGLTNTEKFLISSITSGLIIGLILNFYIGLIFGIFIGSAYWLYSRKKVDRITYPGEGLVLSFRSFLIGSLLCGVIISLISGVVFRSTNWLVDGISAGLSVGLPLGGITLIQHYILRLIVSLGNHLPWRLFLFLDYAAKLDLLQRVGNGYSFTYPLLMKHFSALYYEPVELDWMI